MTTKVVYRYAERLVGKYGFSIEKGKNRFFLILKDGQRIEFISISQIIALFEAIEEGASNES